MRFASTILAFAVGGLISLGFVMLYSAMMGTSALGSKLLIQLAGFGIGLAVCAVIGSLDYQVLKSWSIPLWIGAVALLVTVLGADEINGARRWLTLGPINFQPSELAKLALIVSVAHYLDRFARHQATFWRGLVVPGSLCAVILGLVFVEPDRGAAILLAAVAGAMLLVGGVRILYLGMPALGAVVGLVWSLMNDPLRMGRILSWLNPEGTRMGVGYQAYQGMLALGSGGVLGVGLGNGRQKLGWIPEHETDFIFSVIGEELGLVATLSIVFAFVVVVICSAYIAWHARDRFGFLLGSGVTVLIGLQAFINIGVVTSVLPNKGLPLPFISYGGSNLVIMMACVGLMLAIARRAGESDPDSPFQTQGERAP